MKTLILDNIVTQYKINEQGEIFNTKTNKQLYGSIKSNGYKSVTLTINGIKKSYMIHRLVALTFIPNPNNLPQVNHKDRNKINNNVDNLEWVSANDNLKHVRETSQIKRQEIKNLDIDVKNDPDWKQYLDTNYYFCKDGRGANIKTKKFLNSCLKNQNGNSYYAYYLYINKQRKCILVHRLIYELFSGNIIKNNEQINHIDGNKENNCFSNLEKVTRSENMKHSFYVLKHNIKAVEQYDSNNNLIQSYSSMSEAARATGFDVSGISQAVNGKMKMYKNYYWKLKNK